MFGLLTQLEMRGALRGDLAVRVPLRRGEPVGLPGLSAGRNGELRNDHPYINAVVVIHEWSRIEHHAHTYITHSPGAVRLPEVFFREPDDMVFEFDAHADRYLPIEQVELAGGS